MGHREYRFDNNNNSQNSPQTIARRYNPNPVAAEHPIIPALYSHLAVAVRMQAQAAAATNKRVLLRLLLLLHRRLLTSLLKAMAADR